jgi:3'-5' exoribonuclease 1
MGYIILDLEATCWSPESMQFESEIIEIGACQVNSFMELTTTFSKLVKTVINPGLSLYCQQLTGIRQEEVDKSKTFDLVLQEFIEWCNPESEPICIYTWGSKDYQFIYNDCQSYNIDLNWLYAHVDLKSQFAKIKQLPKPIGLDKALVGEGLEFEGERHRALPDAINLARLFIRYFEEWKKVN